MTILLIPRFDRRDRSWSARCLSMRKRRVEMSRSHRGDNADDPSQTIGVTTDALEFKAKQAGGFRQELRVLGRAAAVDESRSDLILEELWAGWRSWVGVLVGAQPINWSATEAFHPADIISNLRPR